jgi:putative aldouronate transport system substrate-binding protein
MKTRKTILSVLIIAALLVSLAACTSVTSNPTTASTTAGGATAATTSGAAATTQLAKVSLHFITRALSNSKEDNDVLAVLKKKFNADIKWEMKPSEKYTDTTAVIISSGDYPDMLEAWFSAGSIVEVPLLYEEGTIIGLNKLLEKYGPNILKSRPFKENWLYMDDGERAAIPCRFVDVPEQTFMIRQDWLDKLGMKMPKTLDELKAVAKAMTFNDPDGNGKNDTIGLAGTANTKSFTDGTFAIAMGAYDNFYDWAEVNGKYEPWEIREATMKAVKWYRECYQEGIVEKDFMVMTREQYLERKNLGQYGIERWWTTHLTPASPWWRAYTESVKGVKPAILAPVHAEGYKGVFPYKNSKESGKGASLLIFSTCKNPDRVVSLIDYLATDEGADLATFGPEGVAWEVKDNTIVMKSGLTEEQKLQAGVGAYSVVFWKNVFKRDANQLIKDALVSVPVNYATIMNFAAYTGDTSALTSLRNAELVSMIVDPNVNVEERFAAYRKEWLAKGGQDYLNYINNNLKK